jgi:hypothetical protein
MDPINKSEVIASHGKRFWDETIEAFNKLIQDNWDGSKAIIYQNDVVDLIISKRATNSGLDSDDFNYSRCRELIFAAHQLDIESIYQDKGFKITYDKPAYSESYKAYFIFE